MNCDRNCWKSLTNGSLQWNCNRSGFNTYGDWPDSGARVRFGIMSNENNNCESCDSAIGYGVSAAAVNIACGNQANWSPDNGIFTQRNIGYIMVM